MADSFIPTKCALIKKNAASDFKVIKYESHKPRAKKESSTLSVPAVSAEDTRKGIDIKRARREIIKFGISGFSHEKQQEAKVALAISLGARPPKKENRNYKELVAERLRQKRLDKNYAALQQAGKNGLGVSTARKKFVFNKALNTHANTPGKKKKGDLLEIYGKATIDTTPSKPRTNSRNRHKSHQKKR